MAQRRVVAVGAMCPAMLLRHPVAPGGLGKTTEDKATEDGATCT